MEKMSLFSIILLSSLILKIGFLFKNKSLSPAIKIVISLVLLIINFIIFFLIKKCSTENKKKKEKDSKEKQKQEEESKKKEEYERILQERKNHIEELKKEGLEKINIQEKLYVTNMATSINDYQGDKIMITFYGGKLIIYSLDIIRYAFNELLYIKEFDYNTYNAFEMKENKNRICVCGYPGFKIIETTINNTSGKENNSYKVIQYFDCSKYNKEIVKVVELTNDTLISISTDYLLFWNKNENKNNEYEINKDKNINYTKFENLLIISNILKIDEDNIVILKQSNSNLTKSSVNFIKINDAKSNNETEEVKIIDLKITPLDSNTNNLCMIDENSKTFCVGCVNGLGILSGKNMELLLFVEFENTIKNVDVYFDKSIILFSHFEKNTVNEPGQNIYNFVQLIKTNNDNKNYDYKNKKVIKKSSDKLDDDINAMKSFKDGIIVIGDKKGNLQLWH
jgi:hypothetical protein